MRIDITPRIRKPPFGSVQIDWGHPLTNGLRGFWPLNEGIPLGRNLVAPDAPSAVASVSSVVSQVGPALFFSGAVVGGLDPNPGNPPAWQITGPLTVMALARFGGTISNRPIVAKWGISTAYLLTVDFTTASAIKFLIRVAGVSKTAASAGTYGDLNWYTWNGIFDGANVRLRGYNRAGSLVENVLGDATTGPIDNPATGVNLRIGNYNDTTSLQQFGGPIALVGIWARALSPSETLWLATEPYAFLRPVPVMRYWSSSPVVAAASVVTPRLLSLTGVGA